MVKVGLFNNANNLPIGMIVQSMLSLAQFQALNGTSWVMADGGAGTGSGTGNIIGSQYHAITTLTTTPDLRGVVLRGKNNTRSDGNQNPDGDLAVGTFQSHANASHAHTQLMDAASNASAGSIIIGGGIVGEMVTAASGSQAAGANESRMRNVTVNVFIKINP